MQKKTSDKVQICILRDKRDYEEKMVSKCAQRWCRLVTRRSCSS